MKFLLTNDDGYNAQGIILLRDKLLTSNCNHIGTESIAIFNDEIC